MDRGTLIEIVQGQVPAKRWEHIEGVMATAVRLAEQYGVDPVKADLAAILHDCVKFWPVERMRALLDEQRISPDLLHYDKELWHAPIGAYIAERDYGIMDEEVLDAVRYHTSGREQMTLLDKVICLADYMEPGRNFPDVNHIRELAKHSLEKALIAGFDSTIRFLIDRGKKIYPLTLHARNALLEEIAELREN